MGRPRTKTAVRRSVLVVSESTLAKIAERQKPCGQTYKPYGEDGPVAICNRTGKHHVCVYDVPKSYTDQEHALRLAERENAVKEKAMAKTDESKSSTTVKAPKGKGKAAAAAAEAPKKRGNPEALKKAREASAESREASRARKIKLLAKNNPKREGSAAHTRFGYYKTGMTVGEFLDKGGTSADLAYDAKHGYIEVK